MAKPHQAQPNERRIWPNEQHPATILAKLAHLAAGVTEFSKQLTDKVGPLTVEGVHYKPLNRGSLARRLTSAPGYADYAVTFPSADRMRIRATRERIFKDLLADAKAYPFDWLIQTLPHIVRPGDRVILLGAGTGAFTQAAAELVGPSGSVTALDPDAISVAYARKRYPFPNVAHERGTHDALRAEPDGAAETVILTPLAACFAVEEAWRLVSKRGILAAAAHHAPRIKALTHGADIKQFPPPVPARPEQPADDRRLAVAKRQPTA